jgi:signal peptidase I
VLGRVRVAGHSMEPALHHGDELLFIRIPPQVGSVVVARDPRDGDRLLVKRVAWISRDELFLDSDSPGHEGLVVSRKNVLGRAILRYHPLRRAIVAQRRAVPHHN